MLSLKTVSGDHDLDNIRLHNLQPREALTASFSLDTLLVAGSCTEAAARAAASGKSRRSAAMRRRRRRAPGCASRSTAAAATR